MPHARRASWRLAVAVGVVYAVLAAAFVSLGELRSGLGARGLGAWSTPITLPDGYYYVNVGLCLAKGKGFSVDWTDPRVRGALEAARSRGVRGAADRLADDGPPAPTGLVGPVYPALLGGLYRVFGFGFVAPRVLNVVMLGLAGAFLFLCAERLHGRGAALLAVAALAACTRVWACAKQVLTEPTALALLAAALWLLALSVRDTRRWRDVLLGALALAAAVLTRTGLAFCVPLFALCLLLPGGLTFRRRLLRAGAYLAVCLIPIAAWSVRNTLAAGHPVALTSASGTALPAGYTRVCLENGGRYVPLDRQPYAAELLAARASGGEWAVHRKGGEIFRQLLDRNRDILPRLVLAKLRSALLPVPFREAHDAPELVLILLGAVGAVVAGRRAATWIPLAAVVGALLPLVAVFVEDRYRILMLPGLAVLAGVAVHAALRRVPAFSRSRSPG